MLFNSLDYILFLPLVVFAYYAIPQQWRWLLLLVASYAFYMYWKAAYALIIGLSTVIDYWAARNMNLPGARKNYWLLFSMSTNLGILVLFKYLGFFEQVFQSFMIWLSHPYQLSSWDWVLPVGISFYTFQSMSYTIDVYRGKLPAEKHLGKFALFVSFFPQLVAGPIERAGNLLPQFDRKLSFQTEHALAGLRLILWGLFKKVVIADYLALVIGPVYDEPGAYSGWTLLTVTYMFSFQIYCDFSAYSDIAIGSARLFGIRIMDNFNNPYFARSLTDFWKKWHISLTNWFRDYLYIPLGGNRRGFWLFNIALVFILSGLWHGAAYHFIAWGVFHGLLLVLSRLVGRRIASFIPGLWQNPFFRVMSIFMTFHLVTFGWIFFRASSISSALAIIRAIWTDISQLITLFPTEGLKALGITVADILGSQLAVFTGTQLIFVGIMLWVEKRWPIHRTPTHKVITYVYFICLLTLIVIFGQSNQEPFIYFQF